MPADILGTNMIVEDQEGRREFQFQKGPIFTQICLADEINRATPKTQSALLEAMQERSVSIAGHVYRLKEPFFVMATQNPIEQEGTYPLPEAQLDRFFFKLVVGYSSREELNTIIDRTTKGVVVEPEKVMDGAEIVQWQQLVREVILAPHVQDYIARLTLATHPEGPFAVPITNQYLRWGSSPRGAQTLALAAKVRALLERPLQRQLRGHPPRVPAGDAAPRDPQLRGRGRRHRARQGAAGDPGESAGESGRKTASRRRRAGCGESIAEASDMAHDNNDDCRRAHASGRVCRRREQEVRVGVSLFSWHCCCHHRCCRCWRFDRAVTWLVTIAVQAPPLRC